MELLRGKMLWNKRLHQVRVEDALKGKTIVMLYFSFSSCKPHMEFLPTLKDIYQVTMDHKIPLEIIYGSTEFDYHEFTTHFVNDHGNWLAIPFGDENNLLLEYKYGITSSPRAVILKTTGSVVTLDGYQEMLKEGKYAISSWISPYMT